jgi:hypothetical protein
VAVGYKPISIYIGFSPVKERQMNKNEYIRQKIGSIVHLPSAKVLDTLCYNCGNAFGFLNGFLFGNFKPKVYSFRTALIKHITKTEVYEKWTDGNF